MKELKADDAQRPSESRIDEAVGLEAIDYFVVACPKDVTMYEDAIKTSGHQGASCDRACSSRRARSLARADRVRPCSKAKSPIPTSAKGDP